MPESRRVLIFPGGTVLLQSVVDKALLFIDYIRVVYGDEMLINFHLICEGKETKFRGNRAEEMAQFAVRHRIARKIPSHTSPMKPVEVDEEIREAILRLVRVKNGKVQIAKVKG